MKSLNNRLQSLLECNDFGQVITEWFMRVCINYSPGIIKGMDYQMQDISSIINICHTNFKF